MNFILSEEQIVELENRFNWRIPLRTTSLDPRVELVAGMIDLKGKTVLDVGTLDGHIASSLLSFGAKVTTIDYRMSNLALGFARVLSLGYETGRVRFILGDIEALEPEGRWEIIFHSGVFYHLHNPVKHLQDLLPHFSKYLVLETHTARPDLTPGMIEGFGEKFTGTWYSEEGLTDPAGSKNADDSFWLDHESIARLFHVLNLKIVNVVYLDKMCEAGPRSCWILRKGES